MGDCWLEGITYYLLIVASLLTISDPWETPMEDIDGISTGVPWETHGSPVGVPWGNHDSPTEDPWVSTIKPFGSHMSYP